MNAPTRRRAGPADLVVIHADEACLGNGMDPPTPGGAGGLIEVARRTVAPARGGVGIARRDYFVCEPDTTNNRMALRSAIVALELLAAKGRSVRIRFVSDSSYLVVGMQEWVPAWRAGGWRRKGGAVANLGLWQALVALAERHEVRWTWARGHAGHPKNEYADFLARRAAGDQRDSGGLVQSGFPEWLRRERLKGKYLNYDPDNLAGP